MEMPMDTGTVHVDKRDHVAWVTIDRPDSLNALGLDENRAFAQLWASFEADDDLWVAVLMGAGDRAFSVGADLKAVRSEEPPSGPRPSFGALTGLGGFDVPVTKPIIAAVHGYALGAGFELALSCDIILASETARFGMPEGRVGALSGAGVLHRLARQLPLKTAMALLLTGQQLSATDAHRLGLVSEVATDREGLVALAESWAADVQRCSPLYTRAVKQSVMSRLGWPLEIALSTRYPAIDAFGASEDAAEGRAAFRERRAPEWRGR